MSILNEGELKKVNAKVAAVRLEIQQEVNAIINRPNQTDVDNNPLLFVFTAIKKEANKNISRAMYLFLASSPSSRAAAMHGMGFKGSTLKDLYDHFDTMELLDSLDSIIDDLEYNLLTEIKTEEADQ